MILADELIRTGVFLAQTGSANGEILKAMDSCNYSSKNTQVPRA